MPSKNIYNLMINDIQIILKFDICIHQMAPLQSSSSSSSSSSSNVSVWTQV